jgi:hypothetical protein
MFRTWLRKQVEQTSVRYDDLYMIHSGKWIFICFNPDRTLTDIEDRITQLLEEMENQIERIKNEELVEIIKMFY